MLHKEALIEAPSEALIPFDAPILPNPSLVESFPPAALISGIY